MFISQNFQQRKRACLRVGQPVVALDAYAELLAANLIHLLMVTARIRQSTVSQRYTTNVAMVQEKGGEAR